MSAGRMVGRALDHKLGGSGYKTSKQHAKDAEGQLAGMYKQQSAAFDKFYMPLMKNLEQELDSTEIIDHARKESETLAPRTAEMQQRSMSRFSDNLTPAQKAAVKRNTDRTVSIGSSMVLNQGRQSQRQYTEGVRGDVIQMGHAMQDGSAQALSTIAGRHTQRMQQYEDAKRASKGNLLSTIGTVAGGLVGGPVGAAVGGGIGSMVGG